MTSRSLLKQIVALLTTQVNLLMLRQKNALHQAALSHLGVDASPDDLADDIVGCADSVSNIIRRVVPDFPIITGTYTLWLALEQHPRFKRVMVPQPGAVIISPTGTVPNSPIVGHTGIFGEGEQIMSNSSATGTWQQNYTLTSWQARWGKAGYPIYIYQLT